MPNDYCPSPPLPDGEFVPERIPLFTRLVDLEWFVEDKFGFSVPPDVPLGRAIALNANPVPPPPTSGPEERTYLIRLMQAFRRADWSIQALYARQPEPNRQVVVDVHGSFVSRELLTVHGGDRDAMPQPGGIGTLFTAARLAQGGRLVRGDRPAGRITISGTGVKGYDIKYESPLGPMLVERKDRAYEDGLNDDTLEKQLGYVLARITEDAPNIPDQGAARILSVGFWNGLFLSKEQFEAVFAARIFAEFLAADPALQAFWPDCVIIEYMADYNNLIHGRIRLRNRPEFTRIVPVLRAAFPERWIMRGIAIGPDGVYPEERVVYPILPD